MTNLIIAYAITASLLFFLRQKRKDELPKLLKGTKLYAYLERLKNRPKGKPKASVVADLIMAALGYAIMYYYTTRDIRTVPEWDKSDFVVLAFAGIVFSMVVILALGGTIAAHPTWNSSYPLIAIYTACIVVVFAKIFVVLGVVDRGEPSTDYWACLYLSMITFTNLGSGDVVPSIDSRFVAVAESVIGYTALAFSAAVIFTTVQRGMLRQLREYYGKAMRN